MPLNKEINQFFWIVLELDILQEVVQDARTFLKVLDAFIKCIKKNKLKSRYIYI